MANLTTEQALELARAETQRLSHRTDVEARTPQRTAHAAAQIEVHTVADVALVLRATSAEEVE